MYVAIEIGMRGRMKRYTGGAAACLRGGIGEVAELERKLEDLE